RFFVIVNDRLYDARLDQFAAIRDSRHRQNHLQRGDADFLSHGDSRNRYLAPAPRWMNHASNLARQLDSSAITKAELPDVFVKLHPPKQPRLFGCTDVARLNKNVLNAQVAVTLVTMIVQRTAAVIPNAVLAKNHAVEPHFLLVDGSRSGNDFEN